MEIALRTEDRLQKPWPRSLREALSNYIGSDLLAYARKKAELFENAGFNGQNHEIKLTFQAPTIEEMHERLSRLAIGLDSMPVARFEAWRERFGITVPGQTLNFNQPGSVSMPPTDIDKGWSIQISNADYSDLSNCLRRFDHPLKPFRSYLIFTGY